MQNLLTWNEELKCYTLNLPAGDACPAATPWCRGETKSKHKCYGQCGFFRISSVHIAQAKRWEATQDLDRFIKNLSKECKNKLRNSYSRQAEYIRLHSSGDVFSIDYLYALGEVAKNCPEQKFMLPTRVWRIPEYQHALKELENIPNLIIWYSTDPTSGIPTHAPRKNFILDPVFGNYHATMPKPNCHKQFPQGKGKGCEGCRFMCWNKKTKDRCFKVH